jgi:hypothetical protein
MEVTMKKTAFLITTMLTLGSTAYGGGDIIPVAEAVIDESPVTEKWEFRLSPYGWLAGFKGDVAGVPGFPPAYVDISPSDAFDDSEIALMGMFEGKKNGKGFLIDFMYSDSKSEDAVAGAITLTSRTKTTVISGAYLHELYNHEQTVLDAFAGIRYWDIDSHLSLIGPGLGHTESWIDPLIGIKGRTALGDTAFYASGGVAMGGFGMNSELFYDLNANLGYQWSDSIGTTIGYRLYDLDYDNDGFVYDVRQEGWMLGLTWSF